ncbi:hypothetical protein NMY22_g14483 [Coprinellus aureogranulatus]|nr:hypothetical protein NMY22_g14483 [Coprinellus aureogranulatus]
MEFLGKAPMIGISMHAQRVATDNALGIHSLLIDSAVQFMKHSEQIYTVIAPGFQQSRAPKGFQQTGGGVSERPRGSLSCRTAARLTPLGNLGMETTVPLPAFWLSRYCALVFENLEILSTCKRPVGDVVVPRPGCSAFSATPLLAEMNDQHDLSTMLVIDLGEDCLSELLHDLYNVLQSSEECPLIIYVVHSNTGQQELTVPESQAIYLIFNSMNTGTANVKELYIHSRFKSSLPHPSLVLYGPLGRSLRSLVLRYDFDDSTLGLSLILHLSQSTSQVLYHTLTDLTISGTVLLNLLECDTPFNLFIPLANLVSLSINAFRDCTPSLTAGNICTLFDVLGCLTKLQRFSMEEFNIPTGLRRGYALSYLLNRLLPNELTLVECRPIERLPPCACLTLYNIPPSPCISFILSQWDGLCLNIDSSPLVDDTLARQLAGISRTRLQACWPHLRYINVKQRHSTLSDWLEVLEVRSRRLGRPPSPLFVDSQGHRDMSRWAIELSKTVEAATAPNHAVEGVRLRFSNA